MSFSIVGEYFVAFLIGVIQGLTEFLPVSSTAHLDLLSRVLLDGRDFGLSDSNVIQLGTTLALLIYFRHELKDLAIRLRDVLTKPNVATEWWQDTLKWWGQTNTTQSDYSENYKINLLLTQLGIGTLPISVMGFFLQDFVDKNLRGPLTVAVFLIIGACLLLLAEFLNPKMQEQIKNKQELDSSIFTRDQIILIALFQALAIFPGMSRSGSTIAGSLIVGLARPQAARLAFLIGIPALILSGVKDLIHLIFENYRNFHFLPEARFWDNPNLLDPRVNFSLSAVILATLVAYFVGYISLKWLIGYVSKFNTMYFNYYRIVLALVIIFITLAVRYRFLTF
jgi:undecaprenyl-diphosphatase